MKPFIHQTKTHLITGFLGAGKTTLLNNLIQQFQQQEKWAVLINEAGKIGVDAGFINIKNGLVLKEISGGCICCSSQLLLQIALARLLTEHTPNRLIIEPTGLAHPKILRQELTAPHWQRALSLKNILCPLNAEQWQDTKYQNHEQYQSHIQCADIIIINRFTKLSLENQQQLQNWIKQLNPNATIFWQKTTDFDNELTAKLGNVFDANSFSAQNSINAQKNRQFFQLSPTNNQVNLSHSDDSTAISELPFRYCESINETHTSYQIVGWQLPQHWQTDVYPLMDFLLALPNWVRIKGTVQTNTDWQRLNFTKDSLDLSTSDVQIDNRLEVIFSENSLSNQAFSQLDEQLLALFKQKM
ncbi:CobW family GTP-binding protein [Faucicola boevrei]|uniref:CobW family GTP-binding protein n=1 Tax=Faucicola boevrei TaxID=346665 RepID=UPI0003808024|nr:GTP-binding protein [Moraxella boevrei]